MTFTPQAVDFGRVRIGDTVVQHYTLTVSASIYLTNKVLSSYAQGSAFYPYSLVSQTFSNYFVPSSQPVVDSVLYAPKKHQLETLTLLMIDSLPHKSPLLDTVPFMFMGRGVDYELHDSTIDLGVSRIRTLADWNGANVNDNYTTITVTNYGDDTTSIFSIGLIGPNANDFQIDKSSLAALPLVLDTVGGTANVTTYRIRFRPILDTTSTPPVIDTGRRMAIVRIVAPVNGETRRVAYFDTVYGVGLEPYLVASLKKIDFGTYMNPQITIDSLSDTLINIGTFEGTITTIGHTNPAYFDIVNQTDGTPLSGGQTLASQSKLPFAIRFHITEPGERTDTIYIQNDSRSLPVIVVSANVYAGLGTPEPIALSARDLCEPLDTILHLQNLSSVNLIIDSLLIQGDTAGFSFPDTVGFPIHINSSNSFDVRIRYTFPPDSDNGTQTAYLVVKVPIPSNTQTITYETDTVMVSLTRSVHVLNLAAKEPPYKPNAGDAPFELPVYLHGSHVGLTDLGSDTITITFSNGLVQPIGIDRSGSLTENTQNDLLLGVPTWDPANRIYSVPIASSTIASDSSGNDLLFRVLCRVFLTSDTSSSAFISFSAAPCAYRVASYTIPIIYANECGDRTIRTMLLESQKAISVSNPYPNPASIIPVTVVYRLAQDGFLSWQLIDTKGVAVSSSPLLPESAGINSLTISPGDLPCSGQYVLVLTLSDPFGNILGSAGTEISVRK